MKAKPRDGDMIVDEIERAAFAYFDRQYDEATAMLPETTDDGAPCSIAGLGFALAAYPVAAARELIAGNEAKQRVLAILRRLTALPQSDGPEAAGYRGFFYHFLDPKTGLRAGGCEVSTIDSAILYAGALAAAGFYSGGGADDAEIGRLAYELYARADWRWALAGGKTLVHGWTPEHKFLPNRWEGGYSEGLLLYILALGAAEEPISEASYHAFSRGFEWRTAYGLSCIYAGPLFIHQLVHAFIDLRGVQDDVMRAHGLDYFENSRRATYQQLEYAKHNPRGFTGYGEALWGITASDGPGPAARRIGRAERHFRGYSARGAPFGLDDGTVAPWAAASSIPFAPQLVLETVAKQHGLKLHKADHYGFTASYNPTFRVGTSRKPWRSPKFYAINQGLLLLMVENFRSGCLWRLSRHCLPIMQGLQRAGFRGGWLQ